jgi:hypothetical protein
MPERGASTPILIGLFCAMAGAKMPSVAAMAPMAAADLSNERRESFFILHPPQGLPGMSGIGFYFFK